MEIEQWKAIIKKCKVGYIYTGNLNLKVSSNPEQTNLKIRSGGFKSCPKCNGDISAIKSVSVNFYQPTKLTIFEAGLLYYVFVENKLPLDYAQYHKCQKGIEFIKNIKEVSK